MLLQILAAIIALGGVGGSIVMFSELGAPLAIICALGSIVFSVTLSEFGKMVNEIKSIEASNHAMLKELRDIKMKLVMMDKNENMMEEDDI